MLEFNIIITLLGIWLIMFLNYTFLRVSKINRIRFRLFTLRDELAILAMSGQINITSMEYKTLLHILNESIHIFDKFTLIRFLKHVFRLNKDEELREKLSVIIKKLEQHDSDTVRNIIHKYFGIMYSVFAKQTRVFRFFFLPVVMVIIYPISILCRSTKALDAVKKRSNDIKTADRSFETWMNQTAAVQH